ncbi:hypothetical protein [Leifsonia sp. AG29]|uniref:hypothetical protein n=1 Tax=Leifsonia sp. AG29 TaxID=2598860 RepID=UPI00131D2F3C|nr:hypothetical protein [Leifsonia sp. AG29]
MNPHPTLPYNRAHDEAHRLARRHARDLHWAKERRREHERRVAEARLLLSTGPVAAARRPLMVSSLLVTAIGGAAAALIATDAVPAVDGLIPWGAGLLVAAVLVGLAVSLGRLHHDRAAARVFLASREARLSHTQFHIDESVHSFIDSRVLVEATR